MKRILISLFVLIVVIATYWIYCKIFWDNYYNEKWETDYDFHSLTKFPEDSSVTKQNFQDYVWEREIIEPEHGQWINKTQLMFTSDTTMEVTIQSGYISENYFYYPIFKEFINSDKPSKYILTYDKNSLSFPNSLGRYSEEDPVPIQLNKNSITIKYSFL